MTAPRFVILNHRTPQGEHWDLMLEQGSSLATWRLLADPRRPDVWPIPAERIGDHRLHYLTYEGPLSEGRGQVRRIDRGTFELLRHEEAEWQLRFHGSVLSGPFQLARSVGAPTTHWILAPISPEP